MNHQIPSQIDVRQLVSLLGQLGVLPSRSPHGPGAPGIRGIDPGDDDDAAQRVIMRTARLAAAGMIPVAELCPTDSVPAFNIAVPFGTTVTQNIQWPSNGVVVAIRATVADGTSLSMASTALRVEVDGSEELFPSATGNGPGFLPFAMISGSAAFLGQYRTRREFKQSTAWAIQIQNTQTFGAAVLASVSFDIVRTSNLRISNTNLLKSVLQGDI